MSSRVPARVHRSVHIEVNFTSSLAKTLRRHVQYVTQCVTQCVLHGEPLRTSVHTVCEQVHRHELYNAQLAGRLNCNCLELDEKRCGRAQFSARRAL